MTKTILSFKASIIKVCVSLMPTNYFKEQQSCTVCLERLRIVQGLKDA